MLLPPFDSTQPLDYLHMLSLCNHSGTTASVPAIRMIAGEEVIPFKSARERSNSFSYQQRISLFFFASVAFLGSCYISLMSPFYPREAAKRDMSESMVGFVFAIYGLVTFICGPIFGKLLPRMKLKPLFVGGTIVSGIACLGSGLLSSVQNYNSFVMISFICTALVAFGCSATGATVFVIVVNIFPEKAGTIRGLLEIFVGLGMSVSYAIGGLLFSVGGFGLPFYTLGCLLLIIGLLSIVLLPNFSQKCTPKTEKAFKFLRIPSVIACCSVNFMIALTWSVLDPTLEPHLREFTGPEGVSLIFLIMSISYGASCPLWGWLSDTFPNYTAHLMLTGLVSNACVFILLGPMPFMNNTFIQAIILLFLLGISMAQGLMPIYQTVENAAIQSGFPNSFGTHSLITGFWTTFYSLGEIVGPTMAGIISEKLNFNYLCSAVAVSNAFAAILAGCIFYASGMCSQKQTKTLHSSVCNKETVKSNGIV